MPTESRSREERREYEEYLERIGKIRPDAVILLRSLERIGRFNYKPNVSRMMEWDKTPQRHDFWYKVYMEVSDIRQ